MELDCLAKNGVLPGMSAAVVPSLLTASQSLWDMLSALSVHAPELV